MRISFDFDSCLSEFMMQRIALSFKNAGEEIFIITSRQEKYPNTDLFYIADELGIKRENIHFTNDQLKAETIKRLNIDIHFDDMEDEVDEINKSGSCALLFNLDVQMLKYLFDKV